MGLGLVGLGAAAGGFANGLERGQMMKQSEDDAGFRKEQQGRQRKQWKREDDDLSLDDQATAAAQAIIKQDMAAKAGQAAPQLVPQAAPQGAGVPTMPGAATAPTAPVQAPGQVPAQPMAPTQSPTGLGGLDPGSQAPAQGAMPDAAAPGAPPGPSTPPTGLAAARPAGPQPGAGPQAAQASYRPSDSAIMSAAKARADVYLKAGKIDKAKELWAQDEGYRFKVRASLAPTVKSAIAAGGDITAPLKSFYDTMDDGNDLVSATPAEGLDGKGKFTLQTVNRATGKTESKTLSAEELSNVIDMTVTDPAKAAQHAWEMKEEEFKSKLKTKSAIEEEAAKRPGKEADKQADQKRAIEVANIQAKATTDAARIRADSADYRTDNPRPSSNGGSGSGDPAQKLKKTTVDSEGFMVGTFGDGSARRLKIDGQPVKSGEWGKRVDKLAGDMAKGIDGMKKTPTELRKAAEDTLGSSKPAIQAPPGLPEGSKQIGTSKGKPVYLKPDGTKWIQE